MQVLLKQTYWTLLFIASAMVIISSFKLLRNLLQIQPVLIKHIVEAREERRELCFLILLSVTFYFGAWVISLVAFY